MQTPYKTITTAGGGAENPFIYVISFLFNLFRASAAAFKAGIAKFKDI
jgi:hypothetical protein